MDVFDWSTILAGIAPAEWLQTRGQNVKLALIDTGVNLDIHSLEDVLQPAKRFYVGKPGFSVLDTLGKDSVDDGAVPGGHGTRMAGIMVGKANESKQDLLNGLAFNSNFIIIKARENFTNSSGDFSSVKSLLLGLELAANLGVEIAVTAQSFQSTEVGSLASEVQRVTQLVQSKGMLVICAPENRDLGEDWTGCSNGTFPSSVSAFTKVSIAPTDISQARPQINGEDIDFLLGGFLVKTYGTGNRLISPRITNSYAAAIMGGLAATAASFLKSGGAAFNKDAVLTLLAKVSQDLSTADGSFPNPIIYKKA